MRTPLKTYICITPFRSIKLGKKFNIGDEIKAPLSLGKEWLKLKFVKNHKIIEP